MELKLLISLGAFYGAHNIFTQNCVEVKLLKLLHEILHKQMVGYVLLDKSKLDFKI